MDHESIKRVLNMGKPNNDEELIEQGTELCRQLIELLDVPIGDEIERTPERMFKALLEQTRPEHFAFTTFENGKIHNPIVVKDIQFSSLCEHHVLPFFGTVSIIYVPFKLRAGLSKIPRLVKAVSKTLTTQEDLTNAIADELDNFLDPVSIFVVVRARHFCMEFRGIHAVGTETVTYTKRGADLEDHDLKLLDI